MTRAKANGKPIVDGKYQRTPVVPDPAAAVRTIQLGDGSFVVNHGYLDGAPALFIEPAAESGDDASQNGVSRDGVALGGIAIVFANYESFQALVTQMNAARDLFPAAGE